MIGTSSNQYQLNMFKQTLMEQLDSKDELCILAKKIPWGKFEKQFSSLYSHTGKPAKSIRRMVGLLILKYLFNLSDRKVVKIWRQNIYFQFFCGEAELQWSPPCHFSDLSYFRRRIGAEGANAILAVSVQLHGDKIAKSKEMLVDTTVQPKNITYPTNTKLHVKIIEQCNKIAEKLTLKLRRSYKFTVKKLTSVIHYCKKKSTKLVKAASKKLKTIAGRQIRNLQKVLESCGKLPKYIDKINLFQKVLSQEKNTKNKIYSLHEPTTSCIAKGKAFPKYEFGSKISLGVLPRSNIIVSAVAFQGNPHDSKTLKTTLDHATQITEVDYRRVIVDRGYRGSSKLVKAEVITPDKQKNMTAYQKRRHKKRCRSRSAIEAVIGHVKHDYRMIRNYLKGTVGDSMNATLAAAAFNFGLLLSNLGN